MPLAPSPAQPAAVAPPQQGPSAPPGAAPAAPGGPPPGANPSEQIAKLREALTGVAQGLAESGAPPEAIQAFGNAAQEFDRGMEILSGGGGPQQPQPVNAGPGTEPVR